MRVILYLGMITIQNTRNIISVEGLISMSSICRLESQSLRICSLPRESRLVFTVIGRQQTKLENEASNRKSEEYIDDIKELGSASLQVFNYEL